MKYGKILKIAAYVLILSLFCIACASCSSNGTQSKNDSSNKSSDTTKGKTDMNMDIVNVKDFGAKDFIEPVECKLDETDTVVAVNGIGNLSVGDNVRIANGVKTGIPGVDLRAEIIAIEGNKITLDRNSYSSITTKLYIDSTDAFKKAFDYANSNDVDVVIPEGNYYVDSQVNRQVFIQTNVKCEGKIYTTNKGRIPLFIISRKEEPIEIRGSSIAGSLEAGTKKIPELGQYAGYDVMFQSSEILMLRNNGVGAFYSKNEANRIKSDGSLAVEMVESYNNKNLLLISLYKQEKELKIDGLNVLCLEKTATDLGKTIIEVNRSNVTFDNLILDNENLEKEIGQYLGVLINESVNVTLNNSKIRGFMRQGLGYPVRPQVTLYVTLNNTDISYARHAISGMYDNYTTINGGSYEAYAGVIDRHWGHNLTVNDAIIKGEGAAFCCDGGNLTVNNCDITTGYYRLMTRRDCPSFKGNLEIKNTKVIYTGTSNFKLYYSPAITFDHDADLYNPNLIIENLKLELVNYLPVVDIYHIENPVNINYTPQKLPETIWVKDLYITGKDDIKLKNTYFRMLSSTSKYYSEGTPDIYLENIKINSESSIYNYDGLIAYHIYPDNTEITDTHFNLEVKNCGTLSFEIVPAILGDILVENCKIVKYSYYGDLLKDWPNNTVWWQKGTGKTVFKNVKFDRTGLSPSTIYIMNDAEFENCEFTNFGTIDYMNF
ncbi:MAG TPA: hypothetical protein PK733_06875, partial [Clostridiales bacterium]|nr:hypothetical protein [Clostridiales bacterium]